MTSPAQFIVDPLDSTQLLVGTCRLWRGPVDGSSWTSANAVSRILDGISSLGYCNGDALIRTIAALPVSGGSEVVYLGMYGALDGGATLAGHVLKATYNPASASLPTWQDLTRNPVVNDQVSFNYYGLDISSIFVDPHDATGNTVYITVEGAPDSFHSIRTIYSTTDGGAHWAEIESNLPHSPANAVVIDPQDANTAYVATDEGVYSTRQVGACAVGPSNCWSVFGSGLPFAPVVQLSAAPATTTPNVLVAGTYGRGIWQIPLWTAGTQVTTASAQPNSLTFASQSVGTTSAAQTVTFTNTGGIALVATSISPSANFSETDNCTSIAVNAGGSCAIQVSFTPGQTGDSAGQLTINANISGGGQILIPLSGTGVSAGVVTASPGTLSFGQVEVETTSALLPVTVENAGSTAVPLTSVTVTPPFALAANGCGSSLAPNSDCALSLTFAPTEAGAVNGSLVLTDGAGTQTVALSGTGATAATDALSPASLSFPATTVAQQSSAQTVTLTNNGDLPLISIGVTIGAGFQQSNTCGTSLTGHASCAINVVFAPVSAGAISGDLSLSDAIKTQTVALSGTGLQPPAIGVAPAQLTFTKQLVGQAGAPLTLNATNIGGAPLSNIGFQITGPSVSSFSWGSTTCMPSLNNGSGCTVQVTFTPATAGPLTATLIVTSSTLGVNPVQVPLSGIGQSASGIIISPTQIVFAQPTLGQASAAQAATITNTSSAAATGLALSVPPPFSLVQNSCSATLASGGSCSTGVVFTPTTNGVVAGALTVSSSGFAIAATATLSGIGGAAGWVQVQPGSLNFSATGAGNASSPQIVTLTNNGSVPLAGLTFSTSSEFQVGSTTCTGSLVSGSSCTAQIIFSPSSAGQQTGNLTISSSALATSTHVALSGMGFDFSVSSNGQSGQAVSSGQTASFTLNLAPMSGSSGTFTFSCTSLPANSSCTFNPASAMVSANATGSVTARIATGLSSTSAQSDRFPRPFTPRAFYIAFGLIMLPFIFSRRRRGLFLSATILLASFGVASCAGAGGGGGAVPPSESTSNNTPPGTYSVIVTASANGLSHQIKLSLTVD